MNQINKALEGIVDIQSYLVGMGTKRETIGERILKSDQLKRFIVGARVVTFNLTPREFKTAIIGTGSANDPLTPSLTPTIDAGTRRPLLVRDLLPVFPTVNGAIEMPIKATASTGSPAVQNRENTGMGEAAYTFTTSMVPVETLGFTLPVSKQIFEDAGTLDAVISTELLHGLGETEQNQILNGSGASSQLDGLVTNATAWTNESPNITNELDVIRSAIKQVDLADFTANAIILNPSDWYDIDTRKAGASDDTYAAGDPRAMAGATLWGLPVVVTNTMASGTFLVGDFNRAAVLFDREEPQIEISRHHDLNFQRGMLTLSATQRLALVVKNTTALVTGSL